MSNLIHVPAEAPIKRVVYVARSKAWSPETFDGLRDGDGLRVK